MSKILGDTARKSLLIWSFLLTVSILTVLNIRTYPYIPVKGVILSLYFFLISSLGAIFILYRENISFWNSYWIVFLGFSLASLSSRVIVNTSGIGTPRSAGTLGPLTLEQLWINGLHLHHYWLGVSLLLIASYALINRFSDVKAAFLFGIGLALIVDELGIILAGHYYHSRISYVALAVSYSILLVILYKQEIPFHNNKLAINRLRNKEP